MKQRAAQIHLGYSVGDGMPVAVPLRHLAVTGQTQQSGKTTTLEALVERSGTTALTFVTKRGEGSFGGGHRIAPYFRDRADWQFVTSIIDATLQEKNKFLRPWIMKICRTTRTLAEVWERVQKAMLTAKGINEGVYIQLDAYLELIVPEIERADLAPTLDLKRHTVNVMDISGFATPMQMLFVQSALDWVNETCTHTTVVIPEAWEFIPEGKGSPVKASAIALARKGAAIGNHIWIDSQDMAGVDKTVLRGCTVWLIGVQREANELKRNLANIPAGIKRPQAAEVATLERGQFFACFGTTVVKTYVQPAWMSTEDAYNIATGAILVDHVAAPPTAPVVVKQPRKEEPTVTPAEAKALRAENDILKNQVANLQAQVETLMNGRHRGAPNQVPAPASFIPPSGGATDMDAIYAEVKRRAAADPGILRLLASKPELDVVVQRKVVTVDGSSTRGRIAKLLAEGFYDGGATNSGTRSELARTGSDVNNGTLSKMLSDLVADGFLTREGGNFKAVPGMKVNIREQST